MLSVIKVISSKSTASPGEGENVRSAWISKDHVARLRHKKEVPRGWK